MFISHKARMGVTLLLSALLVAAFATAGLAQTTTTTNLTIVHGLTTDADPQMASDVYIDGVDSPVASNVVFGDVVDYGAINAGADLALKVYVAGSDVATATPYLEGNVTIVAGQDTTVSLVFADAAASTQGVAVTTSDLTQAPADGNGWIEYQMLAGTTPLDVYVDDTLVFPNLNIAAVGTVESPAGSHTVTVVPAGQDISAAIYGPETINLAAGSKLVLYGVGNPAITNGFTIGSRVLSDVGVAPTTTTTTVADSSTTTTVPAEVPTGDSALDGNSGVALITIAAGALIVLGGLAYYRKAS